MEGNGTLLRRVLHGAARAARSIAHLRPPSPPPTPATPGCWLPPTPSLLDCTDDDYEDEASFHTTASTTPLGETSLRSRQLGGADVDRRAEEFIDRFRRNASLELRYCSPGPQSPAVPPTSPDTYFNISRLHGPVRDRGTPPPPPPGARASGMSIRWPSRKYRPTVQV